MPRGSSVHLHHPAYSLTTTVVDYTSPKNISRARGGYLGMVSIKQGSSVYTIWARPGDVSEVAAATSLRGGLRATVEMEMLKAFKKSGCCWRIEVM